MTSKRESGKSIPLAMLHLGMQKPRRVAAGAAALMLGVSALALTTGGARADCSPAGTGGIDFITCDAAGADNSPFSAGGALDIVNIVGGTYAGEITGGPGDDLIIFTGGDVGIIGGGSGGDSLSLISGTAGTVNSGTGSDTVTLSGATVTGQIQGSTGDDVFNLITGSAGSVNAGGDNDTVNLNGATVSGNIVGASGDDQFNLNGGSVNSVLGEADNDTITLGGATVAANLVGGSGDDTINLNSGTFGGDVRGEGGNDTVTIASTFDLSTITGNLDGGTETDALIIQADGTLAGGSLLNWERIDVDGATLLLDGAGLTTGAGNDDTLGLRAINGATIDLDDGFAVTGNVVVESGGTLLAATPGGTGAFSVSSYLFSNGTIDMSGTTPAAGDVLTVGNFNSGGSTLIMDVALDSSLAADLLVINGDIDSTGTTTIVVNDVAPDNPAVETAGITLVNNPGGTISEGDFALSGGQVAKAPFVYVLSLEGNTIILQSDILGQVLGYGVLAELTRDEFSPLHERLGDQRYLAQSDPTVNATDNAGVWARIDGTKRDIDPGGSAASWNSSRAEAEVGLDIPLDAFGGVSVFGISGHMIHGTADVASAAGTAAGTTDIGTTGIGAGLSMAFFLGDGFYADVQGRITGWDADVDGLNGNEDINALSWGTSLEVGKHMPVASNTSITPRGRVIYTDVHFDSFTDSSGAEVSQDDSASVVLEAGLTLEQAFPTNGVTMFVDGSINHDVMPDSSVDVSGINTESGLDDTWGELQFGASMATADGVSAFVAADVGSPFTSQFGDSWSYGLEAGFRINF